MISWVQLGLTCSLRHYCHIVLYKNSIGVFRIIIFAKNEFQPVQSTLSLSLSSLILYLSIQEFVDQMIYLLITSHSPWGFNTILSLGLFCFTMRHATNMTTKPNTSTTSITTVPPIKYDKGNFVTMPCVVVDLYTNVVRLYNVFSKVGFMSPQSLPVSRQAISLANPCLRHCSSTSSFCVSWQQGEHFSHEDTKLR